MHFFQTCSFIAGYIILSIESERGCCNEKKINITEGIFPMPVLMVATYNEDGSINVMNAAWGTMQERDTVALNLTETHKTVQNIKARGAFTVSIADAAHVTEADYFGVESGNREPDKFARSRLTATKSETVDAPIINNFPPRTKRQSDKLSLTALNITCLILYGILPIHVVTAWADSSGNVLPDIGSAPLQLMILP